GRRAPRRGESRKSCSRQKRALRLPRVRSSQSTDDRPSIQRRGSRRSFCRRTRNICSFLAISGGRDRGGGGFSFYLIPHLLDFAVRADEEGAAHNAGERAAH